MSVKGRKDEPVPVIGVLWMLSLVSTFFTGISCLGAVFPNAAKTVFVISLAAFASASIVVVGAAFIGSIERRSGNDK